MPKVAVAARWARAAAQAVANNKVKKSHRWFNPAVRFFMYAVHLLTGPFRTFKLQDPLSRRVATRFTRHFLATDRRIPKRLISGIPLGNHSRLHDFQITS